MKHAALPRWAAFLQDNVLLSLLMLSEGYILGITLATGWVANLDSPHSWGVFHGVGVILFFATGVAGGGLMIRLSYQVADAIQSRRFGIGLFNFSGLIAVATCEIWASLSERSNYLIISPADRAVLTWLGFPNASVSPTIIIIAFLPALLALYWGFAAQPVETVEDPEMIRKQLEIQQLRAEAAAKRNATRAAGWREMVQSAVKAKDDFLNEPMDVSERNIFDPTQSGADTTIPGQINIPEISQEIYPAGTSNRTWTWRQYANFVREKYYCSLSATTAQAVIRQIGKDTRDIHQVGQPYVAPIDALKRHAQRTYANATRGVDHNLIEEVTIG